MPNCDYDITKEYYGKCIDCAIKCPEFWNIVKNKREMKDVLIKEEKKEMKSKNQKFNKLFVRN